MTAKLTMRGVCRRFDAQGHKVTALQSVDLDVQEGEFLVLVGPSGCGKSTLLNILAGLDKADEGQVLMNDKPIAGPGLERGVVFQDGALFPWLSVRQNVEFGLLQKGIQSQDAKRLALEALEQVKLSRVAESRLHTLSGGMRQRVAIARSWVLQPEVLLMDEPFSALDALTREDLYVELQELLRLRGSTVVFVTHNVREAVTLGDRVVLLASDPGRIQAEFRVDIPRPRHIEHVSVASIAQEISYEMKCAKARPEGENV